MPKQWTPSCQARFEKAKAMTAVEDLKSYSEIAQAHADGLKNFIPVFEALYASMSDDQKKDADTLFRYGGHIGSPRAKANDRATPSSQTGNFT